MFNIQFCELSKKSLTGLVVLSRFNPIRLVKLKNEKRNTILWPRQWPFSKETKGKQQEFLNYFSIGTGFICKPIGDTSIKLATQKIR